MMSMTNDAQKTMKGLGKQGHQAEFFAAGPAYAEVRIRDTDIYYSWSVFGSKIE